MFNYIKNSYHLVQAKLKNTCFVPDIVLVALYILPNLFLTE